MKNALLIIFTFLSIYLWAGQNDSCSNYIEKAKQQFSAHNNASALKLLNKARKCNLSIYDKIFIYDLSSQIYENFKKYSNAIRYLALKENILDKITDTSNNQILWLDLYQTYLKLGQLHQYLYEYNISRDYFIKAISTSYRLNDKSKTAQAYKYLADSYFLNNQYNQALSNYYYSLKNFKHIQDIDNEINILFRIAQIYSYQGLYKSAFESYFKIVELSKNHSQTYLSMAYIKIAELLSELNLLDEAQKYLNKAKIVNSNLKIQIQGNLLLTKILIRKRLLDSAKSVLATTLKIVPKDNTLLLSDIYDLLGITYLTNKEFAPAYKYFLIAYNLRLKSKDQLRLALSYLNLGRYYLSIEDYDRAKIYLKKSYRIFNSIHNYYYLQLNAFYLSFLYQKINDYKQAFYYLDKYRQIEDSIVKRNQIYILNTLENKSKAELEKSLMHQKLKITQKYNLILKGFTIALLLLLFLLFYLIRRIKRKNYLLNQQKQKLEQAHKEIKKRYTYFQRLYIATYLSKNSIFVTKPDGTIIWFNKTCQEIYSLSPETIGKNLKDLSTYKKINQVFQLVNNKKTVRYINFHIFEGKKIWLQTTISPLIKNGKVFEIIAIEHDITNYIKSSYKIRLQQKELQRKNQLLQELNEELKRQQEELAAKNKKLLKQREKLIQQQEELRTNAEILSSTIKKLRQFSIAIESTDNLIFFINNKGEITWANKAFIEKTNFDMRYINDPQASKKWLENLFHRSPDFKQYYLKTIKEKKSFSFISSMNFNNQILWLQTTLSPIQTAENITDHIVVIQTDITKLKKAEEKLAQKNKEIISSIQYAKRIQQALLPMDIFLKAIFYNNYFIFFKPRDIVSGDFYWARVHKGKILFAIADGTGHGIPGAFMSVIGTMTLNAVSEKMKNINASYFLSELKETISLILRQRGKKDEARDSIDLAFCIFDFQKKTLEFAGAYIPLYIAHKNPETKEIEITTLQTNKTTIGFDMHNITTFQSHKVNLRYGDMIYITTDGYVDQFGGENNKKFKKRRFLSLLKRIYHLPVNDQLAIIKQEFYQWKGNNQQVDDVLVFGLRIDENLT